MTLTEMKEQLRNLQNELRQKVTAGATAPTIDEVKTLTNEASDIRTRMSALRDAISLEEAAKRPSDPTNNKKEDTKMSNVSEIRASKEYTRAFAAALATGYQAGRSAYREEFKPLHDVMTESGNTQGGYLVPVEMDMEIQKKVREIAPLAALAMNRQVSSNTGWVTVANAAASGFAALGTTAAAYPASGTAVNRTPVDATSPFSRVTYTLTTYGLTVPVEKELQADEVSNLIPYITGILADQDALLRNSLVLGTMPSSGVTATASDVLEKIMSALAVTLDPALARNAVIVTNQDGYAQLDALKDDNKRYMLQPMPTDPTSLAIRGHKIVVVPNSQLASTSSAAPIYVADMAHYAGLFLRGPMELYTVDHFENYETRIHAFTRADAEVLDSAAACLITTTL